MSVDLTLLPFDGDSYSHTILQVDWVDGLWDAIKALPSLPVGRGFNSYRGFDESRKVSCYGRTMEDAYGGKVRYATAEELLKVSKLARGTSHNRAVWAYLQHLPAETKVALYWW